MNSRIIKYVDNLFEDAPKSRRTYEIKEEILANVNDNYNDLINTGMDENTAYNRAIANIGNIDDLIQKNSDILEKEEEYRKKSSIINAISTTMYILSPIPLFILKNEVGLIILIAIVAAATGLLTYNSHIKPRHIHIDDDLYNEFIQWKDLYQGERMFRKQISSIISTITAIVYFLVSFTFGNWHISWIIFLIGGLIKKMYFTYRDMTHTVYEKEVDKYEKR